MILDKDHYVLIIIIMMIIIIIIITFIQHHYAEASEALVTGGQHSALALCMKVILFTKTL